MNKNVISGEKLSKIGKICRFTIANTKTVNFSSKIQMESTIKWKKSLGYNFAFFDISGLSGPKIDPNGPKNARASPAGTYSGHIS